MSKRSLREQSELEYARIFGNADGPDEVDEAISVLRRARAILDDGDMMRAVRQRHAENRTAVKAADAGDSDDA